jgi:hypothetical protein
LLNIRTLEAALPFRAGFRGRHLEDLRRAGLSEPLKVAVGLGTCPET